MKTLSEKQLKEKANKVFEQYPNAKEVYATVDGNIFLVKNRAELHSKDKIYTFGRPISESKPEGTKDGKAIKPQSADVLIEEAKTIETVEAVTLAKEVEEKGKNRTTVIAAYDARLEELAKSLEVKQ